MPKPCHPPCVLAAAGPPIPPDTPLKLLDPTGSPVRNDNLTNYAYVGAGNGTTPPELYLAYHADQLADATLIQPGQTTKLQNEQVMSCMQLMCACTPAALRWL